MLMQIWRWLTALPARYYRALGRWGWVPFVPVLVLAIVGLGHIQVDPGFAEVVPDDDPLRTSIAEAETHMRTAEYITLLVAADEPFDPAVIEAVDRLSTRLAAMDGMGTVVSATTAQDLVVEDGALESRPLVPEADPSAAEGRLLATPLFRTLLLTPDERTHKIYGIPEADANDEALAAGVLDLAEGERAAQVYAFGEPVREEVNAHAITRDIRVLGAVSLLVVFAIELAITRRLGAALALWLVSAIAGVITLALFPVLGEHLNLYNVMVPIVVVVLATSYGIHVLRYASSHPEMSLEGVLRGVTPIIYSASLTTVVGFMSLLLTRIGDLRSLGLLIMIGIVVALVMSVFCLPSFLGGALDNSRRERPLGFRVPAPSPIAPALLLVVVVACVVGVFRVQTHPSLGHAFAPGTEPNVLINAYRDLAGGADRMHLYIDTGEEYGMVDMDAYRGLVAVTEEIRAIDFVAEVLAVPMFVEWINGRLAGESTPLPPENGMELGESFELLYSQDTGLGIDAILDPSYRRTRILFTLDIMPPPGERLDARREAVHRIAAAAMGQHLPGVDYLLGGSVAEFRRSDVYLARSQVASTVAFFAFLAAMLFAMFRNLRWAAVAMLPVLLGILFYYGISGLVGAPVSLVSLFFVAALMGVSVDDVLYLTLSVRQQGVHRAEDVRSAVRPAGGAIVQTTLIIAGGMLTFLFASHLLMAWSGLVYAACLALCTGVTLFVVPLFLERIASRDAGKRALED